MGASPSKEATTAWNDTGQGILKAAKAIHAVREKIGGKGAGSFSGWAEEELQRSQQTASDLAMIGARHAEFTASAVNVPASWTTLRVLASEQDDRVFKVALRRELKM